jgi:predicted enzyme related to lactoylglutathione lyase
MCFLLRKFIVYLQGVKPVDMKLEVVVLGVSDVDRAKAFYQNLGWRCSRKSLPTSQNYLL